MYVTNVYSCLCGASILFHDSFNKKWLDFTGHQQQEFQVPRNHHLENNPLRKFQHTVPPSNIPRTKPFSTYLWFWESTFIFGIYMDIWVRYVFSHGFFRGSFQGENFGAQDSIFPGRCSCSSGGLRRLVPHPQRFSARRRPRRAQPTQLLVEPKKTTVAEVQVEWRCGEVWFNNQKIVRDDDFFLW